MNVSFCLYTLYNMLSQSVGTTMMREEAPKTIVLQSLSGYEYRVCLFLKRSRQRLQLVQRDNEFQFPMVSDNLATEMVSRSIPDGF